MAKKTTAQIQEQVTNSFIKSLENGNIPWEKPWISSGGFQNYVSKRKYRGINPLLLHVYSLENDWRSPYFISYNQANDLSYKQWCKREGVNQTEESRADYEKKVKSEESGVYTGIRKGEKANIIIYWNTFQVEDGDKRNEDGSQKMKSIPYLKYINTFNTEQTDLEIEMPKSGNDFNSIEEAEKVISEWEDCPDIKHGGDIASYVPAMDIITMPSEDSFSTDEFYYKTLFHESIHATGSKKRLDRENEWGKTFGSDPYAKEELIAEIGASMLMNYVGIENPETRENSEAYIQHWIKRFQEDHKLIVSAGGKAQKAIDWILDEEYQEEDKE